MGKSSSPTYTPARVSIILHQFGWGGVERVAAILANGFAERGLETELLICAEGGPGEAELRGILGEKVALRFFREACGSRSTDLFKGFIEMGKYLRHSKPNVVLSAGNNISLFSLFLTRLFCSRQTRLFIKTTNPVLRPHDNHLKRFFRRSCYAIIFRFCDGVLTLSDAESAHLCKIYKCLRNKIVTVCNPYVTELNRHKAPGVCARIENRPKLLMAVGRMHHQKRFDVLLQAFARAREKIDCRLVILGDGEDRSALKTLSIKLGIAHLIEMPGYVSNVHMLLSRSDLLVLSSDYEGLPAVVLEALAQNCPVVSTDSFLGARELLGAATRCDVTPTRDPEALAAAIVNSLSQKCSTSGLFRLASRYEIEPAIDSHISAMNQLLNREQISEFQNPGATISQLRLKI
jgi:glycosyltransferase involved in cell wall biosynthesis